MQDWYESGMFNAEPCKDKKKYFMVFAYPTTSGTLHVGHARSYSVPDFIARFKRARGYNVFFPLGFHATGIDCIKIFDKISKSPSEAVKYGISEDDAKKIKSPEELEKYFEKRIINSLKALGVSVDIRTRVSTIDPQYNKFIQWQFRKLKEAGYIIQQDYRLAWCPKCNNPVSLDPAEADISEWKGAQIKEYTIIKFKFKDMILPVATMRPETIFGVTNIWLKPNETYCKANVDGEHWIIAKGAVEKLKNLGKNVKVLSNLNSEEIIGEKAKNPVTSNEVEILPGDFVDPSEATGIVMSVPAHDPFDWLYVKAVAPHLKPVQVVKISGFGSAPAGELLAKHGIKDTKDPRIEAVVKELYKLEFSGKMLDDIPIFGGLPVSEAKVKIVEYLEKSGVGDKIYEFSVKPLHCRCGTEIIIKKVPNQWFIDYSNREWKALAKKAAEGMVTYPEEYKKELPAIIDWLEARPCVRRRGFGTKFPFDDSWTIEALSDSTIYMAFYVVSKYINTGKISLEDLDDVFFDYVFLGKGKPKKEIFKKIREEFEYWYPLDLNAGGKEHKSVHFPFFIFHHVAIFPERFWPKGIFLNWHLVVEGQKMSKHLGNVIFLDDAVKSFGPDAVRLYLATGCSQWADFNWSNKIAQNYVDLVSQIKEIINRASEPGELDHMERWLNSRFNRMLEVVTALLEKNEIKKAADMLVFSFINDLKWYTARCARQPSKEILKKWLVALSIFIPFTADELWQKFGKGDIFSQSWPEPDQAAINPKVEAEEEVIRNILADVNEIKKITKAKKINKVTLIVSEKWKYEVWNMVVAGAQTKEIMEKYKKYGNDVIKFIEKIKYIKDETFLTESSEYDVLCSAKDFFKRTLGCDVEVLRAAALLNPSPELAKKAKVATPGKPGIVIEAEQ